MNVVTQTAKHSAAGQYLGYGLQSVRLCYHLLSSPEGAKVSVEHLDDVAIHLSDGSVILEQCKSATKGNPISDWAADLWKTLANWLDFMAAGEIDPATARFELYVTPSKTGTIASALNDAVSVQDVEALTKIIAAGPSKSKACATDVTRFLEAIPAHRQALVSRLRIKSEDTDPVDPIRAKLNLTVDPAIIDMICQWAVGSAKEKADRLIRAGQPAMIDADLFRAEFRAFVQKNNLPGFLTSFTQPPESGAVAKIIEDRPTFVRQLELIDILAEGLVRAVGDYLRTAADVSMWGERGMIFEKNLRDWNDDLIGRFEHIAGEIVDTHAGHSHLVCGRVIYRRCASLQAPLDGRAVPGHFVHGSFNALADDQRLGWHPEYLVLLSDNK